VKGRVCPRRLWHLGNVEALLPSRRLTLPSRGQLPGYALQLPLMSNVRSFMPLSDDDKIAKMKQRRQKAAIPSPNLWRFLANDGNARAVGLFVVGIPALYAALTFLSERVWPEPDLVVVILAKDFLRGSGVNTTAPAPCYEGLLLNEPPYAHQPNAVEYRAFLKREGKYSLLIEYAAAESRPVTIQVNTSKFENALAKTTVEHGEFEGWCNNHARWENVGVVTMKRGANLIRISRPDYFPHLKTLKLVREET
jgi:hypothetical protein